MWENTFILNNKSNEYDKIIQIIAKNKIYNEFLEYLKNQWFQYFKKNDLLDYQNVSKSFRSNSFIENYNGRIKRLLGNKKTIQWPKFLSFIISEEAHYKELLKTSDNIRKIKIKKIKRMSIKIILLKIIY